MIGFDLATISLSFTCRINREIGNESFIIYDEPTIKFSDCYDEVSSKILKVWKKLELKKFIIPNDMESMNGINDLMIPISNELIHYHQDEIDHFFSIISSTFLTTLYINISTLILLTEIQNEEDLDYTITKELYYKINEMNYKTKIENNSIVLREIFNEPNSISKCIFHLELI